jgi:putative ubiquitin-RnfH superfamily antitoxin RatB of RatAB toxin-antitoxin module
MKIAVAYANNVKKYWLKVDVPEACTLREGIERSGILGLCPEINLLQQKVGIFGKQAKPDSALRPGDRVEIYRPIVCDPAKVPRKNGADDDDDDD